jgi:hypothetical protein
MLRTKRNESAIAAAVGQAAAYAVLCLAALFALTSSGCGKRGVPTPPKERVLQLITISGFQRGNQIILSWKMPVRNASKGSVLNISRADIYRLAEPANAPVQLSEEEFANRSTLIATVELTPDDFGGKTINYRDALRFAGQAARLRYAIRFVNASGQKAGFSNALLIEPSAKVAGNPILLSAEPSQDAVHLKWNAPGTNIDGSTPVSLLGYNVYRSNSNKEPAKLLNKVPITQTGFDDEFFDFEKDYYYFVRAVSVGTSSEPIESAESNILTFRTKDTFKPSPPSAITLAATQTTIAIFFAVNPEKDVVGYKIYRSTDPDIAKEKWEILTQELLKTNTFQDTHVESGKKYYYFLTATDKFGNTSDASEVVTETVP